MAETEKKFSVILVVALIVLGLALAGGMSYFIATKIVADQTAAKSTIQRNGTLIKVGDPKDGLILNIGGVNSGRYLKIGIILDIKLDRRGEATSGKLASQEEAKILDTVVYVLRSQRVEDFDPTKQDRLKEMLKQEINKAMGMERVYEVYITDFVLQ